MIKLYSPRPIVGESYVGVKRQTVPKQSMSLREIVRRFVRKEPLAINTVEGVYETRFGDLEKMKTADIFDQLENAEWLSEKISDYNAREKSRLESEAAASKKAQDDEVERRIAAAVAAAGSTRPPGGT